MISPIVYGPVPSRRLGHSLGINNIPPKICSYSCVYCQLGKTLKMQVEREPFYEPDQVAQSVKGKIELAGGRGESIDYLTFVPDGEPTLDANLGQEIELLKPWGKKIAVITNASLLWRKDVRQDLQKADWVSLKIDAISREIWQRIDRPQKSLSIHKILDGMLAFRDSFKGKLTTESMLVQDFNDNTGEIEKIGDFLVRLKPGITYLAIPTRPPAVKTIHAASEKNINMGYQIFKERLFKVECLIGYEGNAFAFTGNLEDDLLSITAVHPMREDGVAEFLIKAGAKWDIIKGLIKDGKLIEMEYEGRRFYMRKLPDRLSDICRRNSRL